jgi:hypothetical protein
MNYFCPLIPGQSKLRHCRTSGRPELAVSFQKDLFHVEDCGVVYARHFHVIKVNNNRELIPVNILVEHTKVVGVGRKVILEGSGYFVAPLNTAVHRYI